MFNKTISSHRTISEKSSIFFYVITTLMNLIVIPMIVIWTIFGILISPLLFVILKIVTPYSTSQIIRQFIWVYGRGWVLIVSPFVFFKREGFKEHKIKPPCILIVNHLSFFDTYCMGLLPFSDVTFAVRSWPFRMFWYAPFMRLARYLDVESMGWEKSSEAAKEILSKGGALLFFPEGHRSRDGELRRFHSGSFRLAVETGITLVPLCITGTNKLLPPGRWWLRPTRVRLRALSPVDPGAFSGPLGHTKMRKSVKDMMAKDIAKMKAEED